MKSLFSKIDKNDIKFYAALAFFAFCCVCRFLGSYIVNDKMIFGLIETKTKSVCITCIYFFMFFVFYILCTVKHEVNKKTMYYFAAFLSVFVFPMFTSVAYFGNREVYAWALSLMAIVFILLQKAVWLSIPCMIVAIYMCPNAIFSCACCVLVLLLHQYYSSKEKKYLWILLVNLVSTCGVCLVQYLLNGIKISAGGSISLTKFIVLVVLMCPYLVIAYDFFGGLWKQSKGYLLVVLGALPAIIFDLLTKDYSRAFFHVFTYFILVIMALIALKDESVIKQFEETKKKIVEYVPIPSVLIVYPFVFMTLWISGFIVLPKEIFVG